MKKNKLIKQYGIWDQVTSEGLSSYPDLKWEATLDNGRFHLFDTKKDVVFAAHELTKIFRKHQPSAEIEWHIVEIKTVIKKTVDVMTAKIIAA